MSDVFGLVANVVSDRALRTGAKVWILGWNGDAENAQVRGISKGGKTITKYIKLKRLAKFRAAWIPECRRWTPESKLTDAVWPGFQWEDKAHVAELAASLTKMWTDVQFFHRDGRLLRDGKPSSEAFKTKA